MELRHLRYFIAVAERLHFAQAAEALGIAPPTLTVQIQEMERALQTQLFRRTRRSVALTPAGEAFLAEARETIAQFERTLHVGQRAGRGELGRIHIGYVGSAAFSGILQKQLRAFRKARPHVLVQVTEHPMGELPALLEEGRIDVAFVRMPVDLPPSLRAHVLARDAFCAALPAEHPLAEATGPIKARALAGESFVVPEQELGTREIARRDYTMATFTTGYGARVVFDAYRDEYQKAHGVPAPLQRMSYLGMVAVGADKKTAMERGERVASYAFATERTPPGKLNPPGYMSSSDNARLLTNQGAISFFFNKSLPSGRKMSNPPSMEEMIEAGMLFCGTPDEVAQQITAFCDAMGGVGNMLVQMGGMLEAEENLDSLRLFGSEVVPRLLKRQKAERLAEPAQ